VPVGMVVAPSPKKCAPVNCCYTLRRTVPGRVLKKIGVRSIARVNNPVVEIDVSG
jgi:hypothetical protein